MDKVRLDKGTLLAKVRENRQKHLKEYEEACAGYIEVAKAQVDDAIKRLQLCREELDANQPITVENIYFNSLKKPQCHVADYDQVIAMLEMSIDNFVEMTDKLFSQYVMDRWHWTPEWEVTKMSYRVSSTSSSS